MANPQTWNRYGYVGNMPLNAVDFFGLKIGQGADVFGHDGNCSINGMAASCAIVSTLENILNG